MKKLTYRWTILAIAWALIFFLYYNWYLIPSLENQLTSGLHISIEDLYLLLTAPTLAAIFFSLQGGAMADRLGVKRTVTIGVWIGAVACIGRIFSVNLAMAWVMMFLIGASIGVIAPNLPKMVGEWFPPEETGVASGIYISSMGMGISIGLATGAFFPSWQSAFLFTGVGMVLTATLWVLLARDPPISSTHRLERVSMKESLLHSIRNRDVGLLASTQFLFLGGFIAYTGGFPHALQEVFGLSPQIAGTLLSLAVFGMVAGNLIWPPLADRTGKYKPIIIFNSITSAILLFLAWFLAYNISTWVLVFVGGFFAGAIPPLILAYPPLLPEIGPKYAGGASGIVFTLSNVGGSFILPLVFVPLARIGYDLAFLAIGIVFGLIAIPAFFLSSIRSSSNSSEVPCKVKEVKEKGLLAFGGD